MSLLPSSLGEKQVSLLIQFMHLYLKYLGDIDFDYFDRRLIEILEEYDFLLDDIVEMRSRDE